MVCSLVGWIWMLGLAGMPWTADPVGRQAVQDPDVIRLINPLPAPRDEKGVERDYVKRLVKIRVHNVNAAEISDSMGGAVIAFGSDRTEEKVPPRYSGYTYSGNSGGAANLLPDGIDSLIALLPENTLLVRYSNEESLRDLVVIVRALDTKPTGFRVEAAMDIVFTDRNGKQRRSRLTGQGTTLGERRLHLRTRMDEGGLAQTSDLDVYVRMSETGAIVVSSDWYVDVALAGVGGRSKSSAQNVFRADATGKPGQTLTLTRGTVPLAGGKIEATLRLTPRLATDANYRPASVSRR